MRNKEVIVGRFQLEVEVGSGGMGTVYRGRDLQAGVPVAVKVLHLKEKDAIERFEREAALLSRVSHPGIVRYFDHGTTPAGEHYLAMEWVNGEMLSQRLDRVGLTIRESVELIRQVADALYEVHRFGIIHRDLTPRNLMFHTGEKEQIKIVDFGIARQQKALGLTRTGLAVGSPGYMAPEQVRGEKELDARADLFAIGCILYQCLTGRAPFVGDPFAVAVKVLMNDPLSVAELNIDVSPELSDLVGRMLAKKPSDRPRDAAEVASVLGWLREKDSPQRRRSTVLKTATTTVVAPQTPKQQPAQPQGGSGHLNFIILVGPTDPDVAPSSDPEATVTSVDGALAAAVALHHGNWERLEDGTIAVRLSLTGQPTDSVEQAVRCALSIRAAIPNAPMALVGEDTKADDWERLIERGTSTLACEAMDSIFGNAPEGLSGSEIIRLDEETRRLLSHHHRVIRTPAGVYLHAKQEQ